MSNDKSTDVTEVLGDINAGVFLQQIAAALSAVALGTVTYGDKGKTGLVDVSFGFKRIGESNQVMLVAKLEYAQPTMRGKKTETLAYDTPFHVGRGGVLSLMPDTQERLPFEERSFPRVDG